MANTLTPFTFGSHTVRVVMRDGNPWFIAKDVCDTLQYNHVPHAMRILDDDEKGVHKVDTLGEKGVISNDTLGGQQKISVVNESGLYALVLRSRKPEARKFAKWVTSEVLPAIRKTGSYSAAPAAPEDKLPSLQFRRFLVWYDDNGKEQLKNVPMDAAIINPSSADSVCALLGEMIPTALIPEALATLTGRIARALHVPAASKSISIKRLG